MLKLKHFTLFIGDVVIAYIALYLTILFGFGEFLLSNFYLHLFPFTILYAIWMIIFFIFNLYDIQSIRSRMELFVRIGEALIVCGVIGIIFFYSIPLFGITPKINLVINLLSFGILLYLWRRLFYNLFSSFLYQNIGFLEKNKFSEELEKEITHNPQFGYRSLGFINNINGNKIDTLVFSQKPESLYDLLSMKINLVNLESLYESIFKKIPIDLIKEDWFLDNMQEGKRKVYDRLKRIEDIICSIIILIITIPFWIIIPVGIKLDDRGKVFYKQIRVGKNKKEFYLWKFRSMKNDAEKNGVQWADQKDGRITGFGKFLRRSHLDEIPQMINVLRGDISLVGPRPERPLFVEKLEKEIPYYNLRHIIKPGFTGWAQIKFRYARSVMDSHTKFQYDLYYIKNRSFIIDISCILKTFQLFFKK